MLASTYKSLVDRGRVPEWGGGGAAAALLFFQPKKMEMGRKKENVEIKFTRNDGRENEKRKRK